MKENDLSFARSGYMLGFIESSIFYYNQYKEKEDEYKYLKSKVIISYEDFIESKELDNIYRNYITSFIYLSMFVESYIFDYGARRLGDNFVKDHLDKLDIISKWIVIPKLITGYEIDKSKKSFETLKKFIHNRNKLVHHKTKNLNVTEKYKPLDEIINMEEIHNAIIDIFTQLEQNDKLENHLFYLSGTLIKNNS